MTLEERKLAARRAAFARRKVAHASRGSMPWRFLDEVLQDHRGKTLAGYMPIRTEIDPLAVMARHHGPVAVPVIRAQGEALVFSRWHPDAALVAGPFGASVPAEEHLVRPQVVIVPLVAFSRSGGRLGYGGGFYDRTLQGLRAKAETLAVGFAYAAQEDNDIPLEPTDQPLDLIVTETGVITPS